MKKRTLFLGLGVIVIVAASLGFYWAFGRDRHVLKIPGTVEVQEIRLGSKVGGRVADVHVREGDTVEAGAKLITFEAPELTAQRLQLEQKVRQARLDYKKAMDGPRPQERAEAEAAWLAAKARWDRMESGWRK